MKSRYLFMALALAGCGGKSPEEHAKAVAIQFLNKNIHAPNSYSPESIEVVVFPSERVKYYINDQPQHKNGHLVLYDALTQKASSISKTREATLVTEDDSVFAFFPFRHVSEFNEAYGVKY